MASESASGAELLVEVEHLLGRNEGTARSRVSQMPYTTSASPSEQTYEPSPDAFTRESRSATAPYDERQIRELESDVYQDFLENSNWFLPEGTAKLLALQKRLQEITTTSPSTHQQSSQRQDSSTVRRSSLTGGSAANSSPRESTTTNRGSRTQGTAGSMQPTNLAYHRTQQQQQQQQQTQQQQYRQQQQPIPQAAHTREPVHLPASATGSTRQYSPRNNTPRSDAATNAPVTAATAPTAYAASMEQYLPEPVNTAQYTSQASAIREVLIETLGDRQDENQDEEEFDYAEAPETARTPVASSLSSTTRDTGRRDAELSKLPSTAQNSARSHNSPRSNRQEGEGRITQEREAQAGADDDDVQSAILAQLVEFVRAECAEVAMPRTLFYDVERECRRAHAAAEGNLSETLDLLHDEREWIDTRCGVLQDRLNDLERRKQCVMRALGNIQVP